LSESDPPSDMRVMVGVPASAVPALRYPNALLSMLPVVLVRTPADVVRSILKFLVSQPHDGPVGSILDDTSRRLDDAVSARSTFAQP
jgi:hypothetical protein